MACWGDRLRPSPCHWADLHVLGTPPAFVLSQDQTLKSMAQASAFAVRCRPKIIYAFTLIACSVFKEPSRTSSPFLPRRSSPTNVPPDTSSGQPETSPGSGNLLPEDPQVQQPKGRRPKVPKVEDPKFQRPEMPCVTLVCGLFSSVPPERRHRLIYHGVRCESTGLCIHLTA